MRLWKLLAPVASLLGGSFSASAAALLEDFELGTNDYEWSYSVSPPSPFEIIEHNKNELNTYLLGLTLDYPYLRSRSSKFTGDFFGSKVLGVSADLRTFFHSSFAAPYPVTLVIRTDNGTADPGDDWLAFSSSELLWPTLDERWVTYKFTIPSQQREWPRGWQYITLDGQPPAEDAWHTLMSNVTELGFSYIPPNIDGLFPEFLVAADNLYINRDKPDEGVEEPKPRGAEAEKLVVEAEAASMPGATSARTIDGTDEGEDEKCASEEPQGLAEREEGVEPEQESTK